MTYIVIRYTVRGQGTIPFDMLRYDRACPATESDAQILEHHAFSSGGPYDVNLHRFAPKGGTAAPATERWESFGWKVLHWEKVR